MAPTQLQGSNLTVARSPLATENDDRKLKTHSKVARLVGDFIYLFIIVVVFRKYDSGKRK